MGLYDGIVGQPRAVANLEAAARNPVHAYLFVGPPGIGKREAARAFGASLLCEQGGCGECSICRRTMAERHPDLIVVEREGASIRVQDIDEVVRLAARSPVEGRRKVLVLVDFHLVAQQYARVLKTLEEPVASTVFIVLAEHIPPELITIESRCVRIDFVPVPPAAIAAALEREGVDTGRAKEVAAASAGRIDRARLLVGDSGFAARQAAWKSVPSRLDGTGATISMLTDELRATIETVLEPLQVRQAIEAAELDDRIKQYGERASLRKELADKHNREQRRVRQDELRFGFGTLAATYRDHLVADTHNRVGCLAALTSLQAAGEAIIRNPNEVLLVQSLLVALTDAAEGTIPGRAASSSR